MINSPIKMAAEKLGETGISSAPAGSGETLPDSNSNGLKVSLPSFPFLPTTAPNFNLVGNDGSKPNINDPDQGQGHASRAALRQMWPIRAQLWFSTAGSRRSRAAPALPVSRCRRRSELHYVLNRLQL